MGATLSQHLYSFSWALTSRIQAMFRHQSGPPTPETEVGGVEEPTTQHQETPASSFTLHQETPAVPSPSDPSQADLRAEMDEAVSRRQNALERFRRPYPDKTGALVLDNLAAALVARFNETGQLKDLDEAIGLYHEALEVQAMPQSDSSLNLATALKTRFDWTGRIVDLDEAVVLNREALELLCASNGDQTYALDNLATALHRRFNVTNQYGDLYEAVGLHQAALDLRAVPHPHRYVSLHNLAFALLTVLHNADYSVRYLNRAIPLIQEAVKLQPSPRHDTLRCLADALYRRYDTVNPIYIDNSDNSDGSDESDDADQLVDTTVPTEKESTARIKKAILRIEEAIVLNQEAIALLPVSHPRRASLLHDLAQNISLRKEMSPPSEFPHSDIQVLENALKASQESVCLLPEGHPARCRYSTQSGKILMEMYAHVPNESNSAHYVEEAIATFRGAASCKSAPAWHRFQAATEWTRATSMPAYRHNSACEAYQTAIELRIQLVPLHLDLQSRKDALETEDSLLREAIACAVQMGRLDKAVEFFEGRRAIFWSQAQQLRPPMDELRAVAPELAQKLERLSRALEQGSLRPGSSDTPQETILKEREAMHYRRLYEDWLLAVAEVRMLDGFEDYLLPKPFNMLQNAAANGPVIILIPADMNDNGLEDESIALVVTSSGVENVPLPLLTPERAQDLSELARRVIEPEEDDEPVRKAYLNSLLKRVPPLGSLLQQTHTSLNASTPTGRATHLAPRIIANSEDIFRCVLAILWKVMVEPVIRSLKLEISESLPRLWWCPTGILGQLPIHAAGIYGVDESECLSDYVISSYTPSLNALLISPPLTTDPLKVMVVIQPHTPDHQPLPYTIDELHAVEKYVPNNNLFAFGAPGTPALVEEVLSCLSMASIVHFACHGQADQGSILDSAFILHDGQKLNMSRIMALAMPNASLAFLCACHTARTDEDEIINLAATLLFVGFRGAVATMWSIADEDGPKVAESFYRHLFQQNQSATKDALRPDITQAARALHMAVTKLRSEGCPLKRWVPFINFGL